MYDVSRLEKEWKKYNRKRRYPIYATLGGMLLVLTAGYYWWMKEKRTGLISTTSLFAKGEKNNTQAKHIALLNDALDRLDVQIKEPENSLKKETKYRNAPLEPVEDIPILHENIVVPDEVQAPHKKVELKIKETTSIQAYKDVEKRFYQSHDIDDALFLAKGYYKRKAYHKAAYWALETNKINSDIEESWLIFARSKIKLGKKEEAIHILKSYIKASNSPKARALLKRLDEKKGELKP